MASIDKCRKAQVVDKATELLGLLNLSVVVSDIDQYIADPQDRMSIYKIVLLSYSPNTLPEDDWVSLRAIIDNYKHIPAWRIRAVLWLLLARECALSFHIDSNQDYMPAAIGALVEAIVESNEQAAAFACSDFLAVVKHARIAEEPNDPVIAYLMAGSAILAAACVKDCLIQLRHLVADLQNRSIIDNGNEWMTTLSISSINRDDRIWNKALDYVTYSELHGHVAAAMQKIVTCIHSPMGG